MSSTPSLSLLDFRISRMMRSASLMIIGFLDLLLKATQVLVDLFSNTSHHLPLIQDIAEVLHCVDQTLLVSFKGILLWLALAVDGVGQRGDSVHSFRGFLLDLSLRRRRLLLDLRRDRTKWSRTSSESTCLVLDLRLSTMALNPKTLLLFMLTTLTIVRGYHLLSHSVTLLFLSIVTVLDVGESVVVGDRVGLVFGGYQTAGCGIVAPDGRVVVGALHCVHPG